MNVDKQTDITRNELIETINKSGLPLVIVEFLLKELLQAVTDLKRQNMAESERKDDNTNV